MYFFYSIHTPTLSLSVVGLGLMCSLGPTRMGWAFGLRGGGLFWVSLRACVCRVDLNLNFFIAKKNYYKSSSWII